MKFVGSPITGSLAFLAGGGEMGRLMRAHHWAKTSLGEPSAWPQALKTSIRLILNTGHPMYIWWGPELLCFYNDAYSQSIGPERHPGSLGQPAREVWAEIWPIIGPQIDQVMSGGGPTWHQNQLVPITRNGKLEDVYWTYSYGPIDDAETLGGIGGVLVVCTETTEQILSARRLATARAQRQVMFDQMPGFAAMLKGPEHRFEYVNEAYREISGVRDFIGHSVREVFPELAGQGIYELLDRVYATGERYVARDMLIQLNRPDGERFIDLLYQPVRGEDGEVSGIFVGGYDVTDRVRIERRREALITLDEQMRNAADTGEMSLVAARILAQALGAVRAGYGVFDQAAQTIRVERAWMADGFGDVAGLHHFRDYGSYFEDLLAGRVVANPDVERDPRTAAHASAFQRLGIRAHLDVPIMERGETVAQMFVHSATPRNWTAEEISFVREFVHRTRSAIARRTAEDTAQDQDVLLRNIVDSIPAAVYVKNREGRITLANKASLDVIGLPLDEVEGQSDDAWIEGDELAAIQAVDRLVMETGRTHEAEEQVTRVNGPPRIYLSRKSPLRDREGDIVGLVGSSMDITDRKRAQLELAGREDYLRRVLDQLYAFVGVTTTDGVLTFSNSAPLVAGGLSPSDVWGRVFWEAPWWNYNPQAQALCRSAVEAAARGEIYRADVAVQMAGGTLVTIDYQASPLRDEQGSITALVHSGVVIEERVRAEQLKELLIGELHHRAKNIFTMVLALLSAAENSALSAKEMAQTLRGRIMALAHAHDLIRRDPAQHGALQEVDLAALVDRLIAPYGAERLKAGGPRVPVLQSAVTPLALVIHEFITNTVKYGALSVEGGLVELNWGFDGPDFRLTWREQNGPAIAKHPAHTGFGSRLVRNSIESQLRGKLAYDWTPGGLNVEITIPSAKVLA